MKLKRHNFEHYYHTEVCSVGNTRDNVDVYVNKDEH